MSWRALVSTAVSVIPVATISVELFAAGGVIPSMPGVAPSVAGAAASPYVLASAFPDYAGNLHMEAWQEPSKPAAKPDPKRAGKGEAPRGGGDKAAAPSKKAVEGPADKMPAEEDGEAREYGYREISAFFNIREANANVSKGEWEFEATFAWETSSDGSDDDFLLSPSIKYGVTNDFYVELELAPLNLGDGGDQGNGDLLLVLFYQFLHETESVPAAATSGEMRIPSGQGSSGVDAELHFNVTKTLLPRFRAHLGGFIETANGARGGADADERRPFQWGVGPGFDYLCSEKTTATINYLNRCSEQEGYHNLNILEIGSAHQIAENQHLKLAVDIGLDGAGQTPNFVAKVQWGIEW
jgi:hypothetical protein